MIEVWSKEPECQQAARHDNHDSDSRAEYDDSMSPAERRDGGYRCAESERADRK